MQIAVLDLGSFSFHFAIFRAAPGQAPVRIEKSSDPVRLGAGIAACGRIDEVAWRRATDAIADQMQVIARSGPERLVAVATSAVRDADNGAGFLAHLRQRFDLTVEVLSGSHEAELAYWGARAAHPGHRLATIDLGGGSVEVAAGDRRRCAIAASLPLGVLRVQGLGDDRLRFEVARLASPVMGEVRAQRPEGLLLSGGSARRLARLAARLGVASWARGLLTRTTLARILAELDHLGPAELVALGVEPWRQDTVRTAAVVFDTLLALAGTPGAAVVRGGLREGIALRELAGGAQTSGDGTRRAIGRR